MLFRSSSIQEELTTMLAEKNPLYQFLKQLDAILVVSSQIIFDIKEVTDCGCLSPEIGFKRNYWKNGFTFFANSLPLQVLCHQLKTMLKKICFKNELTNSMISRNFLHENYLTFLIEVLMTLTY